MQFQSRPIVAMALAGLLASQPVSAIACQPPETAEISAPDSARMSDFLVSRSRGLSAALLSPAEIDRRAVSTLFSNGDGAIEAIPDGAYRCRTIKMGGILPLTVYGFFACSVSEGGTRIDKTTGSQRFSGTLYPLEGAVFYRGALHYGNEGPMAYNADAERNQVGCIYRAPGDEITSYRLELPAPLFESVHDVIELVPAD
ncbi:MAG: DUF4893 domain-containing protein [Devosia sp.]|uniref:DUF4893 domain-containing protein n=1 Tax=Devosia sp. TaxID=1871048 RepID=UPI0024C7F0D7|nr:DUF4893 domain-containing protein [Devosia sp.]UYN98751.1 MAG: DUF4893 domain-containing protein [Devosia sp.]